MIQLFDSHCHVDEEQFDEDRPEVLQRMAERGVTRYAVIGSDMATSRHAVEYAESHPEACCAVGIHPEEAAEYKPEDLDTLAEWIRSGAANAIGEIGLDYHYEEPPKEVQIRVCEEQMELAWQLQTPVAFHIREAHQDMLEIMKRHRNHLTGGIIHCFSGSSEIAREYLKLGYYISFAGPVTFKKAPRLQEAALIIPEDRILIETDSPYMAPEPVRGHRNEPTNVYYVCEKLAALRGVSMEQMAEATMRNAMRVYGIE